MSVTIEDKLWMASCFNEPLSTEQRKLTRRWWLSDRRKDELRDEVQVDLLLTKLNEQREFLVKVRDWLDNPSCKRAKIAEEVVKWLREHP